MFLENFPTFTYVSYKNIVLITGKDTENENSYIIEDGKTCEKYIYWDFNKNPYKFFYSNEWIENSSTKRLICINDNGNPHIVPLGEGFEIVYNDEESSSSRILSGKLVGLTDATNEKFMSMTSDIDKIKESLGSISTETDKSIVERLNVIEKTAEGNKTTIQEIKTQYDDDKALEELRNNFANTFISSFDILSKYENSISEMSKDLAVSDDEKLDIASKQEELAKYMVNLTTYHNQLIDMLNNTEEDNSLVIIALNNLKQQLDSAVDNLNNNVNTSISDNTIVPSELTLMYSLIANCSDKLNEYRNSVDDNIILGIGGTVQKSLFEQSQTAKEFNQTMSNIVEEIDGENGLKVQVTTNATNIKQTADEIKLSYMKYDKETSSITVGDDVIKLDAGKVLMTGTLTWESLDDTAKQNLKGEKGESGTAEYAMLIGYQLIKYDTTNTPSSESVLITCMTSGIDPQAVTSWFYKYPKDNNWIEITSNANNYTYELLHNDTIWNNKDAISIKVVVDNIYSDILTITKVYDGINGEDAKFVTISGELIFKYSIPQGQTDFTPHVNSITLIGDKHNITTTGAKWYYKRPSQTDWNLISSANDSETLTINHDDTDLFDVIEKNETVQIKYEINTYDDVVTIMKLYDGRDTVMATLTNDSHVVPCKSDGSIFSLNGAETSLQIFVGSIDDSSNWIYNHTLTNVTGNFSNGGRTFSLTGMNDNIGYVDFVASKSGFGDIKRRFTVTKSINGKDGSNGNDSTSYWIVSSDNIVIKEKVETVDESTQDKTVTYNYTPNTITFNSMSQTGQDEVKSFNCKFIISELVENEDGTQSLVEKYSSTNIENRYVYTISNSNIISIKVDIYNNNILVDTQTIGVISETKPSYTWIRYADDENGTGISNDPTNKEYIGFAYNQDSKIESNDPTLYIWSLIKGTDGVKGQDGKDGTTYYTWIKYSDNPDGTDLYDTPNNNTQYIGIAINKTTSTESNDKSLYVWSKFKGEDGTDGVDGETPAVAILDNEAHTIPCNFNGTPMNYSGAVSTMSVYLGTVDDSSNWNYSIVKSNIEGTSSNNNRTFTVTNITADTGYVEFTATKNGFEPITKRFTLSKVKYGEDGEGAKYVYITGEQVFKYKDNFTGKPSPTSITLTATRNNIKSTGKWQYKNESGTYVDLGITTDKLTVTPTTGILGTKNICTFKFIADGQSDEITVIRITDGSNGNDGSDGEDGLYILVTNESHTVPCDSKGLYLDSELEKAKTEIHVYKGIVETDYNITYTANGCEAIYTKANKTLSLTKLTDNSATVTMNITVDGKQFEKVMTITKALQGTDGKDGTGINIIGELTDVSNLPSTGTPGDAYIINGKLYVWQDNNSSWSDGMDIRGEQGLPGKDGVNGKTTYLHIKYSDDGLTFTSNNGEDPGKWIGQYTDFTQTDSTTFSDYTWKKIAGEDGDNAIVANLSNDSHTVPCDSDGNNGKYTGCVSKISLFSGAEELIDGVTYSYSVSTGISGSWDSSTGTYKVNDMTEDESYVDLKATYNGITYTKRFTISKNKQGEDSYTINMSNENHSFIANSDGKIETVQTTTTEITGYKGTIPQEVTINTLPTVNGLTITNTGNIITISSKIGTDLVDNGTFNITVTMDGQQFIKTFSYSKVSCGEDGEDSYSVYLTNENHSFTCEEDGTIKTKQSTSTVIKAFKGTVEKTPTIGTINSPSGLSVTKSGTTITIETNLTTTLADSGSFNIPFTIDGKNFVKTFSWTKSYKGANGYDGESASYVVVTGEQVFKYANNFGGTPTPSTITLNANRFNLTSTGKWQYLDMSDGNYKDLGVTTDTLTVTPTTGGLASNKLCTFRYITNAYSDTITIMKVSDGSNGKDAYSVVLTNECHSFPCESNGSISKSISTTSRILAYKGSSVATPTIGNITNPSGMAITVKNSILTITALKGSQLDPVGIVEIPITIDGITFTKTFSWTKSYKGANGKDGNDLQVPDWITDWNSNVTEINGTKIVTPKIFAGEVVNGKPTGVAVGKDVLGVTGTYTNVNGIVGYKNGIRTYTLDTDGTFLVGTSSTSGNHLYYDGNKLEIIASSMKIGSGNVATETYTSEMIDSGIKNIQIGGTNLLLNTKNFDKNWGGGSVVDGYQGNKAYQLKQTNYVNGNSRSFLTQSVNRIYTKFTKDTYITISGWIYIDSSVTLSQNSNIFVRLYHSSKFNDYCLIQLTDIEKDKWIRFEKSEIITTTIIDNNENSFKLAVSQNGIVKICMPKLEISNKVSDWSPAPEDTETLLDDAISNLESDLKTQIDGKIQTYYQTTDPSSSWSTTDEKNKHIGDLWQNSSTNKIQRWSGTAWVELKNQEAIDASALAKTKAQVFTGTPTVPYYVGDLWITSLTGTGVVKTCKTKRLTGSYTSSDWVEGLKYIDESVAQSLVDTGINKISIGGRNLLVHKDEYLNTYLDTSGNKVSHNTTNTMKDFIKVVPNEELTFQKEDTNEYFRWNWYTSTKTYISRNANNSNSFTWVVPENAYYIWVSYPNTGNVKVERGNIATDFTPAPEDTESMLDDAIATLGKDLQNQIDGKIETFNQTSDPSSSWTTDTVKKQHTGDIWYNGSYTYRWSGSAWVKLTDKDATNANALASKKAQVFTAQPTIPYYKGDLWITNLTGTGVVKTCKTARTSGSYTSSDWVEGLKYIDSAKAQSLVDTGISSITIGGRNLVKQSKLLSDISTVSWTVENTGSEGFKKIHINSTNTDWVECYIPIYPSINSLTNKLTISFEYQQSTSGLLVFNFGVYNNNSRLKELTNWVVDTTFTKHSTRDGWNYVSYTFDPSSLNNVTNANVYKIEFKKSNDKTGEIHLRKPKLEISTKPSDWTPAPEDTETLLDDAIQAMERDLKSQIDGKIQTYYQSTDPKSSWSSSDYTAHTGDIWQNTSTNKTYRWSGSAWQELKNQDAVNANSLASKKAQVFTNTPTIPYYKGDLWITSLTGTGVVKTCQTTRTTGSYTSSDWVEGLKYIDETKAQSLVDTGVKNISIGGRNLALKTSSSYSNAYTKFSGIENTCIGLSKVLVDGLSVGDTVCVRLIIKYTNIVATSGQTAKCLIQGSGNVTKWNSGKFNSSSQFTLSGSGEYEFLYKFTITSNHLQNAYWSTDLRTDYVSSGSIQYKMFKVENGTKHTDWSPAPEDTETLLDDAITNMSNDLQSQIDGKIQTYYQTSDPSTTWSNKAQHTGDIWYNGSYTYRWDGSAWKKLTDKDATSANALASKKAQIFTATPTVPYYVGDLWITNLSGTGVVKTCKTTRTSGSYTASEWVEGLKYIDSAKAQSLVDTGVKNISIGGRNLVANGAPKTLDGWSNSSNWTKTLVNCSTAPSGKAIRLTATATSGAGVHKTPIDHTKCVNGEKYTISAWIRASKTLNMDFKNEMMTSNNNITVTTNWKYFTFTSTINTGASYHSDIFYCTNSSQVASGTWFEIHSLKFERGSKASDWSPSPEDTETLIDDALQDMANDLQNQIDGKIQTYYQSTDPSTNWTTTTLKTQHTGDIWQNSSTNKTYRWSGTAWQELKNQEAVNANTLASKKAQVFTATPAVPYYKGDLWITNLSGSGVVKTCKTTRTSGSYAASDWVEGLKYTDDTTVNNLRVGGSNLVKQSKLLTDVNKGNWSVSNTGSEGFKKLEIDTTDTSWQECQIPIYPKINSLTNKLTISFEYTESVAGLLYFSFASYNGNTRLTEIGNICVNTDFKHWTGRDNWKYASYTFDPTSVNGKDGATIYKIQFKKANGKTGRIHIRKPMLEVSTKPSDWSPAPEDVDQAIIDKIEAQTQEDIFNKLTNNGQVQGIYLENDRLYINASYIKSGTLSAKYIDGKNLNVAGKFSIDSSGNVLIGSSRTGQHIYWDGNNLEIQANNIKLGSSSVATESLVSQTANNVTYEFKTHISNPNLMRNGCPTYKNHTGWSVGDSSAGGISRFYSKDNTTLSFYSENSAEAFLYSPEVPVNPNTTYSISYIIMKQSNVKDYDVFLCECSSGGSWSYTQLVSGGQYETWTKYKHNITTKSDTTKIQLRFDHNGLKNASSGSYINVSINSVMVCKGKDYFPDKWYAYYNEIQSNITTMSAEGVEVRHSNGARTLLNSTALSFYDSNNTLYSQVYDGKLYYANTDGSAVGFVGRNYWTNTTTYLSALNAEYGHCVGLGAKFNSGDNQYQTNIIVSSKQQTLGGACVRQGLNLLNPWVLNDLAFGNMASYDQYPSYIGVRGTTLRVCANDILNLCVRSGAEDWAGIQIVEDGSADHNYINIGGNIKMNGHTITGSGGVSSSLEPTNIGVLGSIRLANENGTTSQYSNDIWEMYSPFTLTENEIRWTDRIAHSVSSSKNDNGMYECYIEIPYYMTDNIESCYHISITPTSFGQYRIKEKNEYYFIVESDKNTFSFTFEVVAKKLDKASRQNAIVANMSVSNRNNITEREEIALGISQTTGELIYPSDLEKENDKNE